VNVSLGSASKRFNAAYISTGHFDFIQSTGLSKPFIYADSSILPTNDNVNELGSSNLRWKNIYATNFTGNLTGTASNATTAVNATKLNN